MRLTLPHGQEDPDADRRLAQLIRLEGTSAYVVTSQTDLIDVLPARDYPCPIVIATLGYDASSHAFKHLQARAAAAFAVAPLEHLS